MIRLRRLQPCQLRVVYANCSSVATDWVGPAVTDYRRVVSSRPARHVPKMFLTRVKHRQETVCLSFSSAAGPRNNRAHTPVCMRSPSSRHGRGQRPKRIFSLLLEQNHIYTHAEGFPQHRLRTMHIFPLPVRDDGKLTRKCRDKKKKEKKLKPPDLPRPHVKIHEFPCVR